MVLQPYDPQSRFLDSGYKGFKFTKFDKLPGRYDSLYTGSPAAVDQGTSEN